MAVGPLLKRDKKRYTGCNCPLFPIAEGVSFGPELSSTGSNWIRVQLQCQGKTIYLFIQIFFIYKYS